MSCSSLFRHLRQNVVAYLALFVALGGTTYAAAKFTGADIVDNSLTGADVLESSLGQVPSAASADNADKLDGIDSTGFLGATAKAADSDKLDGKDSTEFLGRAWAVVKADGTLDRSAGVSGVTNLGGGVYSVDFVQNAFNCAILATLGNAGANQTAQGQVVANPNTFGNVIVRTADSAGTETPRDFSVALLC